MHRWIGALTGTALLALGGEAAAWGPTVHEAVNLRAIETLPKGLKPFYKTHRLELPSLSPEATPAEEGLDRRFAADRLMPFPFADLPRKESEMKQRFGEAGTAIGRLPWLVHESYDRLVEAFRSKDKARILAESDVLAGLVTDLHNPLALTDNADGQKTNQHGLWVRLTLKLPEVLNKDLDLSPDAAHLLDDPKGYVFSMMNGAYIWVDNILYQEELARRGQSGYTEIYFEALKQRAATLVRMRLSQATGDVGSYWYTAWTAAGRPELQ
jgi:hypothetical protein